MATECKCGHTRCLPCLGTCPVCGDDIGNYHSSLETKEERGKRLKRLLETKEN